jgi:hypothetical protein
MSEDGDSYFIKGPELDVVFAELAGCELAREIGITVPPVAACKLDGNVFAGSEAVVEAWRDVEPFLARPHKVSNFQELFATLVVDIWLANKDRNLGNIVGRAASKSQIEFVLIDFEKSATLRPTPTILSTMLAPRLLWPSGTLGMVLRQNRPLTPPAAIVSAIARLSRDKMRDVLSGVQSAIGCDIPWLDDSINALGTRADRIGQIVEEVWILP